MTDFVHLIEASGVHVIEASEVHVIGASGRSGQALCRSLLADGISVVAVVRNPDKWEAAKLPGEIRIADLRSSDALRRALEGATRIVSCAHARHTPAILAAAPSDARFVLLGSTRKFTRWPDAHGNGVLAGEAALMASGRTGIMLHPTMIYGARGEDNVQRLAGLLRRLPVMPLPGGGRFLVQPIHQSDVVRCIRSALERPVDAPTSVVIAGPAAVRYDDFVRAVAAGAGLRKPLIVSLPVGLLTRAAGLTKHVTALPRVLPEEIQRLVEDKAFDIEPMRRLLRVEPISLKEGLALTFAPSHEY